MKRKQIIGILVLILGIVVILFSMHYKNLIKSGKEGVSKTTSMFGGTASQTSGAVVEHAVGKYETILTLLLVGGIVLVIVGGATFVLGRKKRR